MRATGVAPAAGVSTATVDRTLNNRAGVKERTRDRVLTAAERLGYLPERSGLRSSRSAQAVEIDFLLPGGTNTFLKMLAGHLEALAAARKHEATIRIHLIEGFSPDALARKLLELLTRVSCGIALLPIGIMEHKKCRPRMTRGDD